MTVSQQPKKKRRLIVSGLVAVASIGIGWIGMLGLTAKGPEGMTTPAGLKRNQSLYLRMRDGIQIAIDVWLPPNLAVDQKVPTLLRSTRYWRSTKAGFTRRISIGLGRDEGPNYPNIAPFNAAGYAVVLVDARGSGASSGTRSNEWSAEEIADLGEVIDWIAGQSWSNGKVGSYGVSYEGNTAELASVPNHPAVKAIAPQFSDFDPIGYLVMPGGIFNDWFMGAWGNLTKAFDANDVCRANGITGLECIRTKLTTSGVKPVEKAEDLLDRFIEEHQANYDVYQMLIQRTYSDDPLGAGKAIEDISPYGMKPQIEGSGVPMYVWASWLDAGTVNGALSRYLTFRNPQKLIIGPWNHGASDDSNPFRAPDLPPEPSSEEQTQMLIDFFDDYLKDRQAPPPTREIRYYTFGEEIWKTTSVWPPDGIENQRWYFGPSHTLTPDPPTEHGGADQYTVDFTATTGSATRWHTQMGGDVIYPDRAAEDQKLLTYTSDPLTLDTEITGVPIVNLLVASTANDGAFHVYLEDVAPDGRVTYITEGLLRALHRKISAQQPPYVRVGPYHSYRRADAEPLTPGEVAELRFELYATSVLFKAGHRIRIAIAGHDAGLFARIPAEGTPTITMYRDPEHRSWIDLPMKQHSTIGGSSIQP